MTHNPNISVYVCAVVCAEWVEVFKLLPCVSLLAQPVVYLSAARERWQALSQAV